MVKWYSVGAATHSTSLKGYGFDFILLLIFSPRRLLSKTKHEDEVEPIPLEAGRVGSSADAVPLYHLTANLYDIFRQENRPENWEKAAENQKRRLQKAWFWVPALIFECSKTKTGGFSAGLIFSTNVV